MPHLAALGCRLQYCENQIECRRVLILEFFNEQFNRANCSKTCDNCRCVRVGGRGGRVLGG